MSSGIDGESTSKVDNSTDTIAKLVKELGVKEFLVCVRLGIKKSVYGDEVAPCVGPEMAKLLRSIWLVGKSMEDENAEIVLQIK